MSSNKKITSILSDLSSVRENLLSLSDDIWLNIAHNNTEAMQQGVAFKTEYNKLFSTFETNAQSLATLIQQFTGIEDVDAAQKVVSADSEENRRIIAELNKETLHLLEENFTYKRPFAFVLKGQAYKDTNTWKSVYMQVCACLIALDSKKFSKTLSSPEFISSRGNKRFSENPKELRSPYLITDTIYAEINLSAQMIVESIADLLDFYQISRDEMSLYLREDRNA
ncbi:hypothetical protein LQZ19_17480 [Treponema primitia]|uniref:hypothetical protein n=1 Tax=Treponema primitia TaxID=88058 RepID=UPI00397F2B29